MDEWVAAAAPPQVARSQGPQQGYDGMPFWSALPQELEEQPAWARLGVATT